MTGAALLLAAASFLADRWFSLSNLAGGITWLGLVGRLAGVMAACGLLSLVTRLVVLRRGKPEVEARMLARLYWLVGVVVLAIVTAHGFGVAASMLAVFGSQPRSAMVMMRP
jgi:hypothetical protein